MRARVKAPRNRNPPSECQRQEIRAKQVPQQILERAVPGPQIGGPDDRSLPAALAQLPPHHVAVERPTRSSIPASCPPTSTPPPLGLAPARRRAVGPSRGRRPRSGIRPTGRRVPDRGDRPFGASVTPAGKPLLCEVVAPRGAPSLERARALHPWSASSHQPGRRGLRLSRPRCRGGRPAPSRYTATPSLLSRSARARAADRPRPPRPACRPQVDADEQGSWSPRPAPPSMATARDDERDERRRALSGSART